MLAPRAIPPGGLPLIVDFPVNTQARAEMVSGHRYVYFETARDGVVDRENEMVSSDALWASRELMLSQGDLDISHWAHLPNPKTGRPMPEYRIGQPVDIKRRGPSIYVKGEIYSNRAAPPEDSSGMWADRFWHSITGQEPPAKWFPSVYGRIPPDGIEEHYHKGQLVRRIVKCAWFSVGFALRAQHPELGPVSTAPMGGLMAKADGNQLDARAESSGALHLSWNSFAKAVASVGIPSTDHADMHGVSALSKESLDGPTRRVVSPDAKPSVVRLAILRGIKAGTVEPTLAGLTRAFKAMGGTAAQAQALLRELDTSARA